LRHLGHTRFRVNLGLHGVLALGDTDYILTRKKRFGNTDYPTKRHGQRQHRERQRQSLVGQSFIGQSRGQSPGRTELGRQLVPRRGPAHRRWRHGRIPGRPALRAGHSGDPGRSREHGLPQKGHQEPLTHVTEGPAGHPSPGPAARIEERRSGERRLGNAG
jgi:hypothetical protein